MIFRESSENSFNMFTGGLVNPDFSFSSLSFMYQLLLLGCTAEPWKAAGITLCKPWQVFCYKYNEVEFCKGEPIHRKIKTALMGRNGNPQNASLSSNVTDR